MSNKKKSHIVTKINTHSSEKHSKKCTHILAKHTSSTSGIMTSRTNN